MKYENKVRQSNFELMRIISMVLIILWHCFCGGFYGNVINNCERESLKIFFEFINFLIVVHVNSFILLSGYFQCESKFKMSKLLKNINMVWFYRVILMIFFIIINVWHPTNIEIFQNVIPIDMGFYWFMDVYILLYIISPFLNKLIEKLDKNNFKKMLFVLFIVISVLPYMTGQKAFSNDGYTLYNFVLLYFIGAYIKKYPIKESYVFKNITNNMFQIICICVFLGCASFNFLLTQFGYKIVSYSNIFKELGSNMTISSLLYSNPFVIIQTIAYFCFFGTLNIKNKFINSVSKLVLGVYLIHNNYVIKHNLYVWLKIDNGPIYSYKFVLYLFVVVLLIYISCSIIEFIRQLIFKFIYNRKISCKWRKKYRNWIDNFGIKISW